MLNSGRMIAAMKSPFLGILMGMAASMILMEMVSRTMKISAVDLTIMLTLMETQFQTIAIL